MSLSPTERKLILIVDRVVLLVARHWLALINVLLFLYAGLPFLAPVLMHYGLVDQAKWLYTIYSFNCHQLAYRAFFFFGEQTAYPPEQLIALFGASKDDLFFWRDFLGNAALGYKMAWCERDAAMYVSLLLASILFTFVRGRLLPLNWRWYAVLLAPMALDGFTQLFGFRESDPLLRTITGVLFGIGSVWLAWPYVEIAMRDMERQTREQYERARQRT